MRFGLPSGALRHNFTIAINGKRRAIEHQFVLPANLIDINQRQAGLFGARCRMVQPLGVFAALKR